MDTIGEIAVYSHWTTDGPGLWSLHEGKQTRQGLWLSWLSPQSILQTVRKWGGSQAEFRGLAELRRQQCEFRELKIAFWRECRFVRQELQKSAWRSLGVFTENRDKHVEDACSRGRQRLWAAWFAELTPALGTIHYSQSYHWWVSNSLGPPVETLERPHRAAAVKQSKGYSGPTLAKLNNKPWKNERVLWVVNCPVLCKGTTKFHFKM